MAERTGFQPIVTALKAGHAAAELLHLPDYGATENGHGLIYEKNSGAALQPVFGWLNGIQER